MAQIWDLLEHRHLFRARNSAGNLDDGFHLANMQTVLGSPPLKLLRRSQRSYEFWDAKGFYSHTPTVLQMDGNVNSYR